MGGFFVEEAEELVTEEADCAEKAPSTFVRTINKKNLKRRIDLDPKSDL